MSTSTSEAPAPPSGPDPTRRGFTPPSLLTDLLASGLDAGYTEAAARRAARPTHASRRADRTYTAVAAVVALVAGLLLALGWNEAHRSAPAQEALHQQLVERARSAGDTADALEKQVTQAAAQLAALQGTALSGDAAGRAAQARLATAQIAAGAVAVKGPGLTVTLGDPSAPETDPVAGRAGSTPISEVQIVSDIDIRDVVNVLWAAGAQAIAVNQVRITPLTAIRFAGSDILVDLRTVTSPYTVAAVGDGDALSVAFAQSDVAARFATYAANRGVTFQFDTSNALSLPPGVVTDPQYAVTVPPPTPAPSAPVSATAPASTAPASTAAAAPRTGTTS